MTKTDHLAKAKQYIAIAESADAKREAYKLAREEILSVRADKTIREIAEAVGKGKTWVSDLLAWEPDVPQSLPFERDAKDTHTIRQKRDAARLAVDNPQAIVEAIAEAPKEAQDKIATGLVALPNKAVSTSVQRPERTPRAPKEIEHQLAQAVLDLWYVGERLMDEAPPTGESKVLMIAYAEKAERVSHGIAQLLETGEVDDALRALLAEGVEA